MAEKGDWNWNQQLGFRKVNMTAGGEPRRGLEHPVAWPTYVGYPPTRAPITGKSLDYALKLNGRQGGFTLKTQHPDVLESRRNRAAASNTRIAESPAASRNPLTWVKGAY